MLLHIFNPDHDMALAANMSQYTAAHAGRELRNSLGFLPALWAESGDAVLVDDVDAAEEALRHIPCQMATIKFLDWDMLRREAQDITAVEPWGWNRTLVSQLRKTGLSWQILPSERELDAIRAVSHRRWAATHLLPVLKQMDPMLEGEAQFFEEVPQLHQGLVLKSPWSCSGRGVRYVENPDDASLLGWARKVVAKQGGIMVEPHYERLADFGMEFVSNGKGVVKYAGLSVFQTVKGAYTGNLIATETEKLDLLHRWVEQRLLDRVGHAVETVLSSTIASMYTGPLGIDMMIVKMPSGEIKLHPCVEMNLRRTMGHVALALSPQHPEPWRLLRIVYTDTYHLKLTPYRDNLINTALV